MLTYEHTGTHAHTHMHHAYIGKKKTILAWTSVICRVTAVWAQRSFI